MAGVKRTDVDAVAERASEARVKRKTLRETNEEQDSRSALETHPHGPTTEVGHVQLPDVPQGELDMPPEEVARRAFNHGALLDPSTRSAALTELTARSPLASTKTGEALRDILDNADRAVDILSLVGYNQLRHLRANGFGISRIAKDLGVNVNDLTAFMSQAPTASEDAMIDEEAYADTKATELLELLESANPSSPFETDILKIRMNLLLEMNKRLSHKWAQRSEEDIQVRMPTLNINLTTMAPTPRMIQQEQQRISGGPTEQKTTAESSGPATPAPIQPDGGSVSIDYPAVGDNDDLPVVGPIVIIDDEEMP